jgi:hypothetical protein
LDKGVVKEAVVVQVMGAAMAAALAVHQPESVWSAALAMRLRAQMVVQMMDCQMLHRARMVESMQLMNVRESPVEI